MIQKTDKVVTAWAEYVAGPGWANAPVWVIVCDINGRLREECIQPDEQTAEIRALFAVSAAAAASMTRAVEAARKVGHRKAAKEKA